MSIRKFLPFQALLVAAPLAAQTVHIVDQNNGPGAEFTFIASAIAAASDGDVLLVREGDYDFEDLLIHDMSLIVQAEAGATVSMGTVRVTGLSPDAVVVVRDIEFTGNSFGSAPGLNVADCEGMVWFENVLVSGNLSVFATGGGQISNSSQVLLTRCYFEQPRNRNTGTTVSLDDSEVYLFDAIVEGLDGSGFPFSINPGEDAIRMTDGLLYLVGSTLTGGVGGRGIGANGSGADGGAALVMNGINPVVHVLDSIVSGGAGGFGVGSGANGADGADFLQNAPGALVVPEAGIARDHRVDSPARENTTLDVTVSGLAGDAVFVSTPSEPSAALTSSRFNGPAVVPLVPIFFFGTLPAGGSLVRTFSLGELPPGAEFAPFFSQAFLTDSRFTVSTPSFLLLLDESF